MSLLTIWTKIKGWAALAGVALLAIGVAFWKGRAEGKRLIEAEQARRRLEAVKQRKDVEDEVDQLGHADLDTAYKRWLRDDDR